MTNVVTPKFPANAREIAKAQKGIINCILAVLSLYFFLAVAVIADSEAMVALVRLGGFALQVIITVYMYSGTKYLGYSSTKRVTLAVLCLICCAPLVLIYVNADFMKILRAAGLKIGFLGVNLADIPDQGRAKK